MNKKLNILWTTTNKDTIINMISMYSVNAIKYGWWNEVNIIVWGGSAKLINEDKEIQEEVVIVDLNHPLAGKELTFEYEVLEKRAATEEDLKAMMGEQPQQ